MDALEPRRLLSAVYPSDIEQYMVELINRARANPSLEASRYGIALNEGLAAGTISTTAKQPLAINPYITDAARDHSSWMLTTDTFSHTGDGGSDPGDRMESAGYAFTGSWTWGENIAWSGSTGSINTTTKTAELHENLFVDEGIEGRGHRLNILNNSFREIGAGLATGTYTSSGTNYNALMGTTDVGRSGTSIFLTGVAYDDAVIGDDLYTPGEGLSGVTITATRASDGAVFTTTSWTSGGYSLALPVGTYTVTGSGGDLNGIVTHTNVVIGAENVKRDFTPDSAQFASLENGKLTVQGTDGEDAITLSVANGTITATRNGISNLFAASDVSLIHVFAGAGDDSVVIGAGVVKTYVLGGDGNDHLQGGSFNDTLTGGAGKDKVFGGPGDDRLNGAGGHDKLWGETGKDRLYGGAGWDTLDGGAHVDRFWGNSGPDTMYGQGGNDLFYTRDGEIDYLAGGGDVDRAQVDDDDILAAIEELIA